MLKVGRFRIEEVKKHVLLFDDPTKIGKKALTTFFDVFFAKL